MTPLISEIQSAVCAHFGLIQSDMTADRRNQRVSRPRQVAMYLARSMTQQSYPQIGRSFGDRDHATIIYGVRKIEELMPFDSELEKAVLSIRESVNRGGRRMAFGDGVSGD